MQRRTLLGAAGFALGAGPALAQTAYPDRPIKVVVPFPAGGATDAWARTLAAPMSEMLGQSLVVESRSGAAGMIGAEAVARAPADGYTLLFTISSLVQSPVVFRRSPYDTENDFAPIGNLGTTALVLAINKDIPARTLEEFVAYARGRNLSFGSYSPASTGHVFGQYFSDHHGLGMTHVGYRGEAPELVDLLGGRIHCALVSITSTKEYLRDGRLKGLAALGRQRLTSVPEVPTFIELGYPQEFGWTGIVGMLAPARTPAPILEKLAKVFEQAVARPETRRRLEEMDFIIAYMPPEAFRAEIRRATADWTALVNKTGITME